MPVSRDDVSHDLLQRHSIDHVCFNPDSLAPIGHEGFGRLQRASKVMINDDDRGTLTCENLGDTATNAARPACDEGDPVVEGAFIYPELV